MRLHLRALAWADDRLAVVAVQPLHRQPSARSADVVERGGELFLGRLVQRPPHASAAADSTVTTPRSRAVTPRISSGM
jgi:hypothetical protein